MGKFTWCPSVQWLTVIVMLLLIGYCTADCGSLTSTNLHVKEDKPLRYNIANVSASSLKISHTNFGDQYLHLLNVTEIMSGLWAILVQNKLDAENISSVDFTFLCSDDQFPQPSSYTVTLIILDVNEFAPEFAHPDITIKIQESQDTGTYVYTVNARDPDVANVSLFAYAIVDGDDGYFKMNGTYTGNIILVKSLDYDNGKKHFFLNISATEASAGGKTSYTTLTINVEDFDDLPPHFKTLLYSLSIPEGNYARTAWFTTTPPLLAWDQDVQINQTIRYEIGQASLLLYNNLFLVNANGLIGVNGQLSAGTYNVLVEARQTDKPDLRYATTIVTITAIDVNDNQPSMSQPHYSASVSEAASPQTIILTISASDDDLGNNSVFSFQLDKSASGIFTVETYGHTGIIRLSRFLDREQKNEYTFQVWAEETLTTDHFNSSRSTVNITVLDENDSDPQFNELNYIFNITRTHKQGDLVGQVLATDADDGVNKELTYTFPFTVPGFAINNSSGKITLTKSFSYSEVGSYNLIVIATDGADNIANRRTSLAAVTVNILPNNTSPPIFVNTPYNFNILETATSGRLVGQVRATDDNGDVIHYTMSTNSYLKVNSISGDITLTKNADMDSKTSPAPPYIEVTIDATDGFYITNTHVTVFFLYVNEYPPKFEPHGPVSAFQNYTVDTFITNVTATDDDRGPDGKLTYSFVATLTSTLFKIDPVTGVIKLSCSSCLDYRSYDISVQVTDGGNPPFHATISVPLNVNKTVFEGPRFSEKIYHVTLPENEPAKILLQLSATDPDTHDSSEFVFSSPSSSLIEVFGNGTVYINGPADAEKQSYFVINVSVTDGYGFDTAIIEVNITDQNDWNPILNITSLGPVSLPENTVPGEFVAAVGATDKDVTNSGFSYLLTDGAGGKFHINVKTGIITLTESLDRKQKSLYNITINVLDHGVPPNLGSGNLIVDVMDSNTAPYFVDEFNKNVSKYDFNVEENFSTRKTFGSLHAHDPDLGSSGDYHFKLQAGIFSDVFLLEQDSGNLMLARSLNYEEKDIYILTAFVIDNSYEPKSSSATVTIHVTNVEEPPQWPQPLPTVYVTKSSVCNNQQQQLHAFSQEVLKVSIPGNNYIEYFLLNLTDVFSINKTSGLLKIISSLPNDFNTLGLTACNKGTNLCSNATLTIVGEKEDNLQFCQVFYKVEVNESLNVNFIFLELNTTKPDSTLLYNISAGNEDNKFGIGKNDGKLYIAEKLDRETTPKYTLLISVKDPNSQEERTAQVTIEVQDASDYPPRFSSALYQGHILESQLIGSPVLSLLTNIPLIVEATDLDEFYQLKYSIDNASDTSNGSFNITEKAAIELAKVIDYETIPVNFNKSYTFKVLVTDGMFINTATVTVHIEDDNDNPPEFDDSSSLFLDVTEGPTSVRNLANISVSDDDSQTKLVYSLTSVSPTGVPIYFYIDASTGTLSVKQELDREVNDKYILNVTVTDGKYTIFKLVTVAVADINDNSPQFNQTFNMTVTEGDAGLKTNISVIAFDADTPANAELTYSIVSGNVNQSFEFDAIYKNILRTIKPLDREAFAPNGVAVINLTIEAVDSGQPSRTGYGSVIVTIKDVNDNPPRFSQNTYYASVQENAINVSVILTTPFIVMDVDTDDCSTFQFQLSDTSTPFTINEDSGALYVNKKLDRTIKDNYTLWITAIDDCGKGLNSSAKIIIQITDASDKAPYFLRPIYNFEISQNSTKYHNIGILTAKDDNNGTFIYKLNKYNMFNIESSTGDIQLIGDLESDNTIVYVLNASACDVISSQCGYTTVYIKVTDQRYRCPSWNITSLNLNVMEKQNPGSIGHISVLDNQVSKISDMKYYLNYTGGIKYIEINISGEVRLLTQMKLDKSDVNMFSFSVYAEDKNQPSCILHGTLVITVTGTNDNNPEICYQGICGVTDIELTVFDASPANTIVALISTRDNDTGSDGEVTLNLTSKSGGLLDLFSLSKIGVLSLKKQINITDIMSNSNIQNNTFKLLLLAQDNGQGPRFTNATIKVTVISKSPGIPTFTKPIFHMTVRENETIGTFVGTVTTSSTPGTSLKYSLSTPLGFLPFTIDQHNGSITTTDVLDRESVDSYLFTVQATDPSQQKVPVLALVMMIVEDVNEPPKFDKPALTVMVSEETTLDELLTLKAYDNDEGNNAIITYNLLNASLYTNFALNQTTGVLSVTKSLDRETQPSYDLIIQAVDGGKPALTAVEVVHVTVSDINDNSPHFTSAMYECNITKSEPPVEVIVVAAYDADEGMNGSIIYRLESELQTFRIDPLSGKIQTTSVLKMDSYTLVVVAIDQGSQPKTGTTVITVGVIDNRADVLPSLSLSTNILQLFVGMTAGAQLHVSIATRNAKNVQISEVNGTDTFKLKDGVLLLNKSLEIKSVYVLNIMATSTTGQSVSQELVIKVDNLKFDQQSYAATVTENSKVPQIILDLDSSAELSGISVIYSLSDDFDSSFYINRSTGILSLMKSLDRETLPVYTLNIILSIDNSSSSTGSRRKRSINKDQAFASVLVKVDDQNDNVPSFDNLGPEMLLSVPESVNASYLITTLKAFDPDEGFNGLLRYSISDGDNQVFNLHPVTGELRVESPEKLKDCLSFMLTVHATEKNGTGNSSFLHIKISVVQDGYLFRLSTPLPVSKIKENLPVILGALSQILGYTLSFEEVTLHEESGIVYPDRSDILFRAYVQVNVNTTTNISDSQIAAKVAEHQEEIEKLFQPFMTQAKTEEDILNTVSIALIAVACFLFVVTLLTIIISCRTWKKQKRYAKKEKNAAKVQSRMEEQLIVENGKSTKIYSNLDEHLEMTTLSEVPTSPEAVTHDTQTESINHSLQNVQQSLEALSSESMDSGPAFPLTSSSKGSGQEPLISVQNNGENEGMEEPSYNENDKGERCADVLGNKGENKETSPDTDDKGERCADVLGDRGGNKESSPDPDNSYKSKKDEYNELPEGTQNSDDKNGIGQDKLKQIPTLAAATMSQDQISHSPSSMSSIRSKLSSTSYSNGVIPHKSSPDIAQNKHHNTGNNIITNVPEIKSSNTLGFSFVNEAYQSLNNEDQLSESEAITHF